MMHAPFQNLKNFIRHGKQARQHQEAPAPQSHAYSDPLTRSPPQAADPKHEYSVAGNNKNNAAQASGAAAQAAGQNQKMEHTAALGTAGSGKIDQEKLAQILAEEKANRDRLPRYPGLDRWALIAKMGDGAFSNVYRARDTQGVYGEVAIKVVRKYELNASQVRSDHVVSCWLFAGDGFLFVLYLKFVPNSRIRLPMLG